ncbi:MAG: S-layer homology domain-containing protein, partial [Evtepia sp.]
MRSKSRKSLAVLLAGAMMMSMVVLPGMAVPAAAAQFNDTKGHWAETSIIRWSDNKIVQGSDGRFNPDAFMTRAEMATILTNLLVLQETAKNSFADVAPGSWYESAVLKCAAAGIMKGDGTNANPNGTITREEATTMLGRALAIAPSTGDLTFTDKATVADYAKGYVKAMNEKGIIKGISAGVFGAKSSITRASVATILDRAITTYANKKDATVTAKDKGITLVAAPGVTVTGTVEDLLIAQGASSATTSLKDAKVTGTATVNAAKANIKMIGTSSVNQFTVSANASGVALDLDKTAKITSLTTAADTLAVSGTGTIAKMTVTAGKDVTVAKETTVTQLENKGKNDVKYGDKIVKGDGTAEQPSIGDGNTTNPSTPPSSGEFTTLAELERLAQAQAGDAILTVSPDAAITSGG